MTITYILSAVILLGLCIFIHELGHLLGGKMVGIRAKTFSIGMGKGIIKKKIGDTTYQIAPIPFGGFCQFYGEDPTEERKGEPYEFLSAHPFRRIVTVIMGPLFNLFFGIILFFIMNMVGYSTETNKINIPDVLKSGDYLSPAYSAGLRSGDKIIQIDDEEVRNFTGIRSSLLFSEGNPVFVKVDRNGKILDFTVAPRKYSKKGHYKIGVEYYGNSVLMVNIAEDDVAALAGIEKLDEITSVNDKRIKSPDEFRQYISEHTNKKVRLGIKRAGNDLEITVVPRLREVVQIQKFEDARFKGEKFDMETIRLDLIKKAIEKKNLKINGETVKSFAGFKNILKKNKGKRVKLQNQGGTYSGILKYKAHGFIGVVPLLAPEMIELRYGIAESFTRAFIEPYDFIVVNIKGFGLLFSGELNVRENLSGPIRIAKLAGDVAYHSGISAFIILMAKISIILMVMNLLPIPVVDGSYIIFFLYEAIRGKPISENVLGKIQAVGITLLIMLGIFVIFNDLSFLPFFQKLFN